MTQGRVWECTNDEYHADTSKIGSTMLKTVLRSPKEYRMRYVDDTWPEEGDKDALILGSALHCRVLEPDKFDSLFCVRPEGIDGRTKAGKERLAEFRLGAMGKTELTDKMYDKAVAMADAILAVSYIRPWIEEGIKEQAIVWAEDGFDFECKCKPDIFLPRPDNDSDLILDIKTAADPTPECFESGSPSNPIRKFGYDLQAAHYSWGQAAQTGRLCAFGLIVVGKAQPHDVFVYSITDFIECGDAKRRRAMALIRDGEEAGWQRPEQQGVIRLQPSKWDFEEAAAG